MTAFRYPLTDGYDKGDVADDAGRKTQNSLLSGSAMTTGERLAPGLLFGRSKSRPLVR